MRKNEYLTLLTSVDVLNTLHGGVSEPRVVQNQREQSREMRIKVPGVGPEFIQVEVNNNNLFIYYVMNLTSSGKIVRLPYSIYHHDIPYFIDISKINSQVEEDELIVNLPFNSLANGYHKRITSPED
ncbi:MAG TPA: Hsp20/alpha crystallin family protein [Chryseolinea sp.]|nr:Hsp20/alpha crystallin family protein [Chryseolinea sp.]